MRKRINEVLSIFNEISQYSSTTVIGIDDTDILMSCGGYGISWNIMTPNVDIYHTELEDITIPKRYVYNEDSDIDVVLYRKFISNLISHIDKDTIDEIKRGMDKYVVFERYEDAQLLKEFLYQFGI